MRRLCGMGLILSLCASGCATMPRQGVKASIAPKEPDIQVVVQEAIQQYHQWLKSNKLLMHPAPFYRGWPSPRQLDPETLQPLPPPPEPTSE